MCIREILHVGANWTNQTPVKLRKIHKKLQTLDRHGWVEICALHSGHEIPLTDMRRGNRLCMHQSMDPR